MPASPTPALAPALAPAQAPRQYVRNPPLRKADAPAEPLELFQRWLQDARAGGVTEPTAMCIATVDADGAPSARVVLFKEVHEGGLVFYSNYDSRKGRALAAEPRIAATFWWDLLERQVRFEGRVRRAPVALAERYFAGRPRGSRIGAGVSRQSRVVAARAELDERLAARERAFDGQEHIPLPENWGGYVIDFHLVEFWAGRDNRVHDRLLYRRPGPAATVPAAIADEAGAWPTAAGWEIVRLEP